MSDPGYGDRRVKTVQEQKRAVGYVLCRPGKRNTRARTRGKSVESSAGSSGDFGDDGRHAPTPCCLQATVERVNERPGIWRPLCENSTGTEACCWVCALSPEETKHPSQDPREKCRKLSGWLTGRGIAVAFQ